MARNRTCSKPSCGSKAVATLTYVYSECTAVLGPLATSADPHCYDLCRVHADRMTVPRGWDVVRLDFAADQFGPTIDDLEALADAVRDAARSTTPPVATLPEVPSGTVEGTRRGHLRVLRAADDVDHAAASHDF
ncbi:MAG: DUF3499 domain-containing protein [Actinobacteria bacterium]|nr:DUF3499 domain-containing protein [Actinomycetota bacterium]